MPGQVAGEHADQYVSADAVFQPVPDGPQVQVVLADTEVLLHIGQVLVGGHGGGCVKSGRGDGGADDVDAVEGGFGADGCLVALPGEGCLADAGDEVLGDLALADYLAHAHPDRGSVFEVAGFHHGLDLGEL